MTTIYGQSLELKKNKWTHELSTSFFLQQAQAIVQTVAVDLGQLIS